jgi:general secretion pathway protein G
MQSLQRGLTLIEVMVVVMILGILAALIVPNIVGRDDQARVSVVASDLHGISSALEMFKLDNFSYPTQEQGLEALAKDPGNLPNWNKSGYLKKLPKDPWGKPYLYIPPAQNGQYDIISLGADGQEGGEGVAKDISLSETEQ